MDLLLKAECKGAAGLPGVDDVERDGFAAGGEFGRIAQRDECGVGHYACSSSQPRRPSIEWAM